MIKKMFASALFAGFVAGLIATVLQFQFVQPVLLEAELYESGEATHFAMPSDGEHSHGETAPKAEEDHDHSAHEHSADKRGIIDFNGIDFRRDGLTTIFNIFTYVGYGLVLVAGFAIADGRNIKINTRTGLIWGVAGFVTVQFAPAFGLAPELPGNAAASIDARQIWWLATVIATGLGLTLIAFGKSWIHWVAAIIAIALPHFIGAPHPGEYTGPTPPELAGIFAARALGVGMIAWIVLGLFAGYFWQQEEQT